MKKKVIGVLTSGGDAPGMNAAVRAVTRAAFTEGYRVKAIFHGYQGLINGEIEEFTTESVSGIISRGGTILKSARCKEFMTKEGRRKAYEQYCKAGLDALVCIGGNGTLTGANDFANEFGVQCIGIPATIDNDVNGTDETIGFDTTLNTITECVDKIKDTAASHERIFFVEVMGRDAGWLAECSAISSGAEAAIVPDHDNNVDQLAAYIEKGIRKSKNSSIVMVSESPDCGAMHYAERVKKEYPNFDVRVCILGHMQRGGSPSARDRILASAMGAWAVIALKEGQHNVMIGMRNGEIVYVPFAKAIIKQPGSDRNYMKLIEVLAN